MAMATKTDPRLDGVVHIVQHLGSESKRVRYPTGLCTRADGSTFEVSYSDVERWKRDGLIVSPSEAWMHKNAPRNSWVSYFFPASSPDGR